MATEITQKIDAWNHGSLPWAELVSWLAQKQYATPQRYLVKTRNAGQQDRADDRALYDEDGTWDEVRRANGDGRLSDEQYLEIVREAERDSPTNLDEGL